MIFSQSFIAEMLKSEACLLGQIQFGFSDREKIKNHNVFTNHIFRMEIVQSIYEYLENVTAQSAPQNGGKLSCNILYHFTLSFLVATNLSIFRNVSSEPII